MRLPYTILIAGLALCGSVKAQSAQPSAPAANATQTATANVPAEVAEAARLNAQMLQLYKSGKFDEALPLAKQVLALREKALDPADRRIADALLNLAAIYEEQKDGGKAEPHYQRALTIYETTVGPESEPVLIVLSRLMLLKFNKYDFGKAESFAQRILAIREKKSGADSIAVAGALTNLAYIYASKDDLNQARLTFARLLAIIEKANPATLPAEITGPLANYLALLYRQRQSDEVKAQIARADKLLLAIGAASSGRSVTGGVLNGKAIIKPQPAYPIMARSAHAQGTVVVKIIVDETGKVIKAEATGNSDPSLRQASVEAALRARFTPTFLEGVPVKVSGFITYNFVLQ